MNKQSSPDTMEMPKVTLSHQRRLSIGLPSGIASGERRFPLTPEATAMLIGKSVDVVMERGAGQPIHYPDSAYAAAGVCLAERAETLKCDIVISLAPLPASEIATIRRGTILLTLASSVVNGAKSSAKALLSGGIIAVALDRIADENGNRLIADILHEIDGCASIAIASAMLTDTVHGKGILLGGVTGIVPCEVTVLGSGMGAVAAARCAIGMGATVRLFDNDLYSLRQASQRLDHRVIASSLHPHVLEGALRSADVVIATPLSQPDFSVDEELVLTMKRRVLVFDLNQSPGMTFPALPTFNLGEIAEREKATTTERASYFNVGCQVPRTAAMALSNALVQLTGMFLEASSANSPENALLLQPAMRRALMTVYGKAIDPDIASKLGLRPIDINLFTSLS